MSTKNLQVDVLRALLGLSRRGGPASVDDLVACVGAETADVVRALGALARAQLVQRTAAGPRLSLAGLALAVAYGGARTSRRGARSTSLSRRASIVAKPRITPLVRRRRAA